MDDFLKSGLVTGGLNAAGGIISTLVNQGFYRKNLNAQVEKQKELYDYQNNINIQNLINEQSLKKLSLRRAGLSVADLSGDGTHLVGQSMPSSPNAQMPNLDLSHLGSSSVQGYLQSSQADINSIEADYRGKILQLQMEQTQQQIEVVKQKLPLELANLAKDIESKQANIDLTEEERKKVIETIHQLIEQTNGISIDNKFKNDRNKWEINKLKKEVFKLSQEGKYQEVVAQLANNGIIIGSDWVTQLAVLLENHKLAPFLQNIINSISDCFTSDLIDNSIDAFGTMLAGIIDRVVPDLAIKKELIKSLIYSFPVIGQLKSFKDFINE